MPHTKNLGLSLLVCTNHQKHFYQLLIYNQSFSFSWQIRLANETWNAYLFKAFLNLINFMKCLNLTKLSFFLIPFFFSGCIDHYSTAPWPKLKLKHQNLEASPGLISLTQRVHFFLFWTLSFSNWSHTLFHFGNQVLHSSLVKRNNPHVNDNQLSK